MKTLISLLVVFSALVMSGCRHSQEIALQVTNPLSINRSAEIISVSVLKLARSNPQFNFDKFEVRDGEHSLPFEVYGNELLIEVSLAAAQTKTLTLVGGVKSRADSTKRTQAEIAVRQDGRFVDHKYVGGSDFVNVSQLVCPAEHTDHDDYICYEGPGWESDRVGYRLYLDNRNTIDIFGKKTRQVILQHVGRDSAGSYHEMHWWGQDIFKVGDALGVGSLAAFVNGEARRIESADNMRCTIAENGILRSTVQLEFEGWQVDDVRLDVRSELSIAAGSRLTRNMVFTNAAGLSLCTGLIKGEGLQFFTSAAESGQGWQYIALYGLQSLAGDSLGTALFYSSEDVAEISEDALNHLVIFKAGLDEFFYYFGAAWQGEPDGIKSGSEFKFYLDEVQRKLNHPLTVSL